MKKLMTTAEVAAELRVSTRHIYELYRKGDLVPLDFGHRTKRVTDSELNRYIITISGTRPEKPA